MSHDRDYLKTDSDPISRLRQEGLMLHMKGAGYAFAFCTVTLIIVLICMWIGRNLLDEQSQEADDPTPWSSLQISDDVDLI